MQLLRRRYPTSATIDSTSGSPLEPIRKPIDHHPLSPILRNDGYIPEGPSERGEQIKEKIGDREPRRRGYLSLDHPLPLANTDRSLIDISNLDYGAYRHEIVEATLKKRYEQSQPPADVVLNSLHLNSTDSVIGVRLNDRYDHSLFDFVEEYYDTSKMVNHERIKRLHPLDHFLATGMERPKTTEKETETSLNGNANSRQCLDQETTRNSLSARINEDSPKLSPDVDNNGNPSLRSLPRSASIEDDVSVARNDRNSEVPRETSVPTQSHKPADKMRAERSCVANDCSRSGQFSAREPSWTPENRPASAGGASTGLPKGLALSRAATLPERSGRRVTRSPGPGASAGGSKKKLGDYPNWELPSPSERCRSGKGGSGFISTSFSEVASIRSERSGERRKIRTPGCSRESSISPTGRASRPPWLSANRGTSFNRKYGKTARNSAWNPAISIRSTSARDDRPQRSAISSGGRSMEPSLAIVNRGGDPLKRRAQASFVSSSTGRREADLSASPRRRDKSRNFKRVVMKTDEGIRTTTISDQLQKRVLDCETAASRVPPTKGTKSTCGSGVRRRSVSRDADGRRNTVKLNRGSGGQLLRSAGNSAFAKGASLSPKIELSAEALSRADDTDGFTIPRDEKLTVHDTSRIDPRARKRATEVAESDETRAFLNARDQLVETSEAAERRNGVKSNNINGSLAPLKVPRKITRDWRARPASAGNLAESPRDKAVPSPHRAQRNANAETKSGLSAVRLNARSNDAVGGTTTRREETSSSSVHRGAGTPEERKTRARDIAGNGAETEEDLKLPRRDSKIGLAMNSALRRYIKMLKQGLLNHGDKDGGVALASLSLTDAISVLSEQKMPLSPEETRELQTVLSKVERNPELLYKESLSSIENIV